MRKYTQNGNEQRKGRTQEEHQHISSNQRSSKHAYSARRYHWNLQEEEEETALKRSVFGVNSTLQHLYSQLGRPNAQLDRPHYSYSFSQSRTETENKMIQWQEVSYLRDIGWCKVLDCTVLDCTVSYVCKLYLVSSSCLQFISFAKKRTHQQIILSFVCKKLARFAYFSGVAAFFFALLENPSIHLSGRKQCKY